MRTTVLLLILCSAFLLPSCSSLYGIRQPDPKRQLSKTNLPAALQACPLTCLDSNFLNRIAALTTDSHFKHDLKQPLQLWIFENGTLVANTVNCYANGFPDLKWRLSEMYQQRIIQTAFAGGAPPDKVVFEKLFGVSIPAQGKVALIVSSRFMGRQNKRFLKRIASLKSLMWFECYVFGADGAFQ